VIDYQAAYIGGWLKQIKRDAKLEIAAAGAAQQAAGWICGERRAAE
jgi:antirestriction protein ArdC